MGKHLEQALPSVYTLQCLTGKVDNNNNNKRHFIIDPGLLVQVYLPGDVPARHVVFCVQIAAHSNREQVPARTVKGAVKLQVAGAGVHRIPKWFGTIIIV